MQIFMMLYVKWKANEGRGREGRGEEESKGEGKAREV